MLFDCSVLYGCIKVGTPVAKALCEDFKHTQTLKAAMLNLEQVKSQVATGPGEHDIVASLWILSAAGDCVTMTQHTCTLILQSREHKGEPSMAVGWRLLGATAPVFATVRVSLLSLSLWQQRGRADRIRAIYLLASVEEIAGKCTLFSMGALVGMLSLLGTLQ